MRLILWLAAANAAWAGCVPVEEERLLASDMARVWPAFAAVPARTPLGYPPAPGVRRVIRTGELLRLAKRFGVSAGDVPGEVCFERPLAPLRPEEVLAAMKTALPGAGVRIEIVELSRYPAPRGQMVFPAASLRRPAEGTPALWRGEVRYGAGRRFAVWARVLIQAPITRVRAATLLKRGEAVQPGQVRVETAPGFPYAASLPVSIEEVAGRLPRRSIPEGTVITSDLLEIAPEVKRGETVRVEVSSPRTRLALTGRAESSGCRGQKILVRNPETRKTFAARVTGKGTVAVESKGEN